MINADDILNRMGDDDIHVVLVALDSDEETPKLQMEEEDSHKFISAILETIAYLMETKVRDDDFAFGSCVCATPITPATIERQYCAGCMRTVTVKIGDPSNVVIRRDQSGRSRFRQAQDAAARTPGSR